MRRRSSQPDLIITSDWHLRDDTPTAFVGDFYTEQWRVVQFIRDLQIKYQIPVYHAGDLFNHWKPSPYLLTLTMRYLPDNFHTIYGNHDLPQHNLELADKCGINVLLQAGRLTVCEGTHWGQKPTKKDNISISGRDILMWHVMTYQGKKPWPGSTDPLAAGLLRKYPDYDLIITGHNHKTFVEEHEGRILVNPGGITRQSADQIDVVPVVFLWYAESNTVEKVELPYTEGAISREHLEVTEERDARIDAFISKLDGEWQAGMSFEQNIEAFCSSNEIKPPVMEIINKALEV